MDYYHVRISQKSNRSEDEVKVDLRVEDLEQRVLAPYRNGRPITLGGKSIATNDIERVKINTTRADSNYLRPFAQTRQRYDSATLLKSVEWHMADMGRDVTDELITGPPGSELEGRRANEQEYPLAADTRDVFVVHGRNQRARDAVFCFLRSIDLNPLEWSEAVRATGNPTPYIGDVLKAAFSHAHAVVVLFTPDDEARLREPFRAESDADHETGLTGQARPNVLFEAGMSMGRKPDRTILVELGALRPFSDIAGLHVIKLDNTRQLRWELAQRLLIAGCPVRLDEGSWQTAGDFEAALTQVVDGSSESNAAVEQASVISEAPDLSKEARELLIQATSDRNRTIIMARSFAGLRIVTNGRTFGETGNTRSEAEWQQAIRDLVDHELIVDRTGKENVFEVTHKGFEIADAILASH